MMTLLMWQHLEQKCHYKILIYFSVSLSKVQLHTIQGMSSRQKALHLDLAALLQVQGLLHNFPLSKNQSSCLILLANCMLYLSNGPISLLSHKLIPHQYQLAVHLWGILQVDLVITFFLLLFPWTLSSQLLLQVPCSFLH